MVKSDKISDALSILVTRNEIPSSWRITLRKRLPGVFIPPEANISGHNSTERMKLYRARRASANSLEVLDIDPFLFLPVIVGAASLVKLDWTKLEGEYKEQPKKYHLDSASKSFLNGLAAEQGFSDNTKYQSLVEALFPPSLTGGEGFRPPPTTGAYDDSAVVVGEVFGLPVITRVGKNISELVCDTVRSYSQIVDPTALMMRARFGHFAEEDVVFEFFVADLESLATQLYPEKANSILQQIRSDALPEEGNAIVGEQTSLGM